MDYHKLSTDEFDAVVTGELTHHAIWLEDEVASVIAEHFVTKRKSVDFTRLILRRDGLTFQNKIDIARAMIPLFSNKAAANRLKSILKKVEDFKNQRNVFAHGHDVTPDNVPKLAIHIEAVSRSGKEKTIIVTPDAHEKMMSEIGLLLEQLQKCRKSLRKAG